MNILIAAAELSPYARTGGLGEAVAGIAGAVAGHGHRVTVVIPAYRHLRGEGEEFTAPDGAIYRRWTTKSFEVLALDDPASFDRGGIYGDTPGTAYDDQWVRFGTFSRHVANLAADFDLLHLHDAHTGPASLLSPAPTVFTIHNAAYGITGPLPDAAALLGTPPAASVPAGPLEWFGSANFLKAGITGADVVTTVSPSFARQLAEDPTISGGLDGVIRSLPRPIVGILNGIDTSSWDPATDPALPKPFSASDLAGRAAARRALAAESGLTDGFILGNVGRMSEQKGLGLLEPDLDRLLAEGLRLVLIGNGELDPLVDEWAVDHPGLVWHAPYEERLSRLVSAGADAYLMPSRFEPCGIGQMYAMRYGAVPIVRLTGGLADTVIDLDEDPDEATGFGFRLFEPIELTKTIRRARRTFETDPESWSRLMANGMTRDFSWSRAATEYLDAYAAAIGT